MDAKKFKPGETIYYVTGNNRAGRGVIKTISDGNAIIHYEIKTKFMTQQRTIVRSVNELFRTKTACETYIASVCGNMGNPTVKICRQFYRVNAV